VSAPPLSASSMSLRVVSMLLDIVIYSYKKLGVYEYFAIDFFLLLTEHSYAILKLERVLDSDIDVPCYSFEL
jgi:hypothetical protein